MASPDIPETIFGFPVRVKEASDHGKQAPPLVLKTFGPFGVEDHERITKALLKTQMEILKGLGKGGS